MQLFYLEVVRLCLTGFNCRLLSEVLNFMVDPLMKTMEPTFPQDLKASWTRRLLLSIQ
jgi:hypothetical protein